MSDYGEFLGIPAIRVKFVLELLGEFRITQIGEIRDRFRRAYGEQITAETVQKIADRFPKRVEKAREEFLKSYQKHPLYNKKTIFDNMQMVIELGFQEEAFGFKEWDETDDKGEKVHRVMPLTRIRDLKSVVAANKTCLEIILADEKAEADKNKQGKCKKDSSDDGMGGLTVVR